MIVHTIWKTEYKDFLKRVTHTKYREGWFLLGVFPLYVRVMKYAE